jgi:hypothetical protein
MGPESEEGFLTGERFGMTAGRNANTPGDLRRMVVGGWLFGADTGREKAGRSKRAPLREKIRMPQSVSTEPFEIGETGAANAKSRTPRANTASAWAEAPANADRAPA